MAVLQKQLHANRRNAQKGGVRTPEGRTTTRHHATKHGLLVTEIVVTTDKGVQ
jgi:hypothetical protein